MSKTICILVQVSDWDATHAVNIAASLAKDCDASLAKMGLDDRWHTPFPFVTNQGLPQTLRRPLLEIEDKPK